MKMEDASTTFEDSVARFRRFLEDNGYPGEIVWTSPDDLVVAGKRLMYVRVPTERENEFRSRRLFEQGTTQEKRILFDAICADDVQTFCRAWVPRDQDQAQRALMPKGLKLSANVHRMPGLRVRNGLHWCLLQIRHRKHRKHRKQKDNLFWIED